MSLVEGAAAPAEKTKASKSAGFDLNAIVRSEAFVPGVIILLGVALVYWRLWGQLLGLWQSDDGYYSHGFLVPLIAGYIVYRRWPMLSKIPVKPTWWLLVPLLFVLYVSRIASVNAIDGIMSVSLLATLLFSAGVIAGWRWMLGLTPAILYLAFALPLWTAMINNYTNPLQIYSTKVAAAFLKLVGFDVTYYGESEPTIIYLPNFLLNVEVPCSGLKLLLALTAFTAFFILIARLKWWANLIMVAIVLPLALLVNGLRIGGIGIVGELVNEEAGMQFHDYSGYITLVLCFFVLFKFARLLGWKD